MADPLRPGDFGTDALIQHWRRQQHQQVVAAVGSASGSSHVHGVSETVRIVDIPNAELGVSGLAPTAIVSRPELLVGATLVETGSKTHEGDIVIAVTPLFRRLLRELARDPSALHQLNARQFEELIAGAYEDEGCESVVLTPRSGDRGRDVIVTSKVFGTIRILDQVKLYAPNRVVDAGDVRAMYGVLSLDQRASKGVITTSSQFAPGVYKEFANVMPGRLTLRNGEDLRKSLWPASGP